MICECFNWITFENLEIQKIDRNKGLADLAIKNLLAINLADNTVDKIFYLCESF